jgi:hypothetical protein
VATDLVGVSLVARPLRLRLLVPEPAGVAWQATFAAALASQVRVWGGSQTLVLPTPAGAADDALLWALVDRFDVDWWSLYVPSHGELEDLDPAAHRSWRSQLDAHLGSLPAHARAEAEQEAGAVPLLELSLPDELNRRLVSRAAAFHHEGAVQIRGPVSAVEVPYQLTDVLELEPRPAALVDPRAPDPPVLRLLLAAEVGVVAAPLRRRLEQLGVATRGVDVTDRRTLMRWVYEGERSPGLTPFALAESGLAWFGAAPRAESTLTIVVGEQPWDFALAYALRRERSPTGGPRARSPAPRSAARRCGRSSGAPSRARWRSSSPRRPTSTQPWRWRASCRPALAATS